MDLVISQNPDEAGLVPERTVQRDAVAVEIELIFCLEKPIAQAL